MNPTTLLSGLGAAVTADPTLGGASTTGRESSSGGGDLFLALVAGLLQGSAQEDLGTVPGATPEPGSEAAATGLPLLTTGAPAPVPVPAPTADTPTETNVDETEADPATDASMLPMALVMAPIAVQSAVAAASAGTDGPGDAATPVSSVDVTTGVATAPGAGGSAQAGTDTGADQPTGGGPAAATPTDDSPAPTPTDTADQPAVAAPAGPRGEVRADVVPTQPTGVPTAVGVAPATAPTAVSAPAATADLPRVADQVFPEVLRATSNAENGTSRVTVKLNPESLGEVRVVLTQRRGELEVTLAGGAAARRALTEGAPELLRLLESVGRADSRIFIRDLPTVTPAIVPAASGQATRTDVSTDLAGGAWSGAGRPDGEPAPDRDNSRHHPGSSPATDGIPSATIPSRPIQTAGRTHAGLDLSM